MILVDSNIPMYLVGNSPEWKVAARRVLDDAVSKGEKLVTDVEAFQEILHRYVAIDRRDAIQPAFDALRNVVDEIIAVEWADVDRAKAIALERPILSARDSLHVAVMQRRSITRVMSFDAGYDQLPGLTRLS